MIVWNLRRPMRAVDHLLNSKRLITYNGMLLLIVESIGTYSGNLQPPKSKNIFGSSFITHVYLTTCTFTVKAINIGTIKY